MVIKHLINVVYIDCVNCNKYNYIAINCCKYFAVKMEGQKAISLYLCKIYCVIESVVQASAVSKTYHCYLNHLVVL